MNILVDYGVSENCMNSWSYGEICVQCGHCGRKFDHGFLAGDSIPHIDEEILEKILEDDDE